MRMVFRAVPFCCFLELERHRRQRLHRMSLALRCMTAAHAARGALCDLRNMHSHSAGQGFRAHWAASASWNRPGSRCRTAQRRYQPGRAVQDVQRICRGRRLTGRAAELTQDSRRRGQARAGRASERAGTVLSQIGGCHRHAWDDGRGQCCGYCLHSEGGRYPNPDSIGRGGQQQAVGHPSGLRAVRVIANWSLHCPLSLSKLKGRQGSTAHGAHPHSAGFNQQPHPAVPFLDMAGSSAPQFWMLAALGPSEGLTGRRRRGQDSCRKAQCTDLHDPSAWPLLGLPQSGPGCLRPRRTPTTFVYTAYF